VALLYARFDGETQVNTSIASAQTRPATTAIFGNRYVTVWQDASGTGGDSSLTSIKGQIFDALGHKVGGEFLVNTSTNNAQSNPVVIPVPSTGGFFVAWQDASGTGGDFDSSIKGQFFTSAGAKSGPELRLNSDTALDQTEPAVTNLADGGFAVTWIGATGNSSAPYSYRTQVFEANGTARGSETVVATGSVHYGPPVIIGLSGGGYAVLWESADYIYGRMFNANGTPAGAQFKVSDSVFGGEQQAAVLATPDGGFVAVWSHWSGTDADRNDVIARRFDASGQPVGDSFMVTESAADQQFQPAIAKVTGGYIITWQAGLRGGFFPQSWDLKGQFYDENFNRSGEEFLVNTQTEGHQTDSSVTVLEGGKVVITWQGPDGSDDGIRQQLLAFSGAPTDIALSTDSVSEVAVENMPFATVSASAAVNSNLTYTYLGDSAGGAFRLEGTTLIVNDNGRLDAEVDGTVEVTLRVTDDNGHSYDEVITLQVADSNREARYSAGPERGVSSPTGETAHLASGGFVHVRNNGETAVDLYDAAGTLVRENIRPLHEGPETQPTVAGLSGGGFVLTWTASGADGSQLGVQAQLFDSAGNVASGVIPVNTTMVGDQDQSSVASRPGGGFVVVWRDQSGAGLGPNTAEIKGQLFDAGGNKVGGEFQVNPPDSSYQDRPDVASLSSGGFAVTWSDSADGDVKAQVYDSAGNKIGGTITANTTLAETQFDQKVTGLANGGFVVTWEDRSRSGGDTDGQATRAQVFDNLGNKVGGEILVNTRTAGNQTSANVDATPDGGFIVAWQDWTLNEDPTGLSQAVTRLQFFDAAGNKSGPQFAGNGSSYYLERPAIVVLPDGNLFLSWSGPDGSKARFLTLEHPVVAVNDSATAAENGTATGNVLANDSAQPGAVLQVGAVNGSAANVGHTIVLPSGAELNLLANGNYTYDPNGAFTGLTGVSGGANSSARDSFTYTLTNGTTATVTVTVTGVSSPGEHAFGTAGNDVMVGTPGADFFDMRQGGDDNVSGGGGDDIFYFGRTITGADVVNGGAGFDQLLIQGGGGLRFNVGMVGIETIKLLSGLDTTYGEVPRNLYAYPLTMVDQNVAAGQRLTIDGSDLRVRENLTVNGLAERDGSYTILGGRGVDTLTGGMGHDYFVFGNDGHWGSTDKVTGGLGTDELILRGNHTVTFGADQIAGVETLRLLSAKDALYGPVGTNFSYNITMNDANVAAGVQMTVDAAPLRGSETLTFNGEAETNGTFRAFGGHNGDTIGGGAGADIIQGNGGADLLRGSGGADIFRYVAATDSRTASADQILDFTAGDRIDLSPIDAKSGAGNDAFTWIGGNAFSGSAGELRGTASGNVWTIQGDIDGNGIADLQIVVTVADNHPITAADFFL
jgi:VCBS repeat-containing protein